MHMKHGKIVACVLPLALLSYAAFSADSQLAGVVDVGIEDAELNGQVELLYKDGEQATGSIKGTNLGSDNRRLEAEYQQQGSHRITVEYDQLPKSGNDNAQTIYRGVGSTTLTLPSGWVDTSSTSTMDLTTLQSVDLETERERFKGKVELFSGKAWDLSLTYRRDKKEGTDKIGGAIGDVSGGDPAQLVSLLGASSLPEPIDQVTNQAELVLNYQQPHYQLQATLHASLFENEFQSLTWENPFTVTNGPGTGDNGQLSLAPDNQFYQASLSGGYQFTPTTRLSGVISSGIMLQDENFLPYSIESGLGGALPRNSPDAEVVLNAASLRLTSRPARNVRLKAAYRYNERDNNTPRSSYTPVVIDHHVVSHSFTNEPYSYRKHNLDLSGFYRLNKVVDLGLEYDFDQVERWQAEVEESQEHTLGGILKFNPTGPWDTSLTLRHGIRDGGTYTPYSDPDTTTNPLLRKYHLADRIRDKASLSLNYLPKESLSFNGRLDYSQDDYDDTLVGLMESKEYSAALDVNWNPRKDTTAYGFINYGRISSQQAGSENGGPPTGTPNWTVDTKDRFGSAGLGLKVAGVLPRLDLGADYTYSQSRGDITMDDNSAGGSGLSSYPDLKTRLHSIQLYGRYRWRKDLHIRMSYLHEKYDSSDWALDGVDADTVSKVLLLGDDSLSYSDNILAMSLIYYFR